MDIFFLYYLRFAYILLINDINIEYRVIRAQKFNDSQFKEK